MSTSILWDSETVDHGFTLVPTILLRHRVTLKITNDELAVILHVLSYKHNTADPYPKTKTVADELGVSDRTLSRWVASLKAKGYLERDQIDPWRTTWNFNALRLRLQKLSTPLQKLSPPPVTILSPPPPDRTVTQNSSKDCEVNKSLPPPPQSGEKVSDDHTTITPNGAGSVDTDPPSPPLPIPDALREDDLPDYHAPAYAWARHVVDTVLCHRIAGMQTAGILAKRRAMALLDDATKDPLRYHPEQITAAIPWWLDEQQTLHNPVGTYGYLARAFATTIPNLHPVGRYLIAMRAAGTETTARPESTTMSDPNDSAMEVKLKLWTDWKWYIRIHASKEASDAFVARFPRMAIFHPEKYPDVDQTLDPIPTSEVSA